LSQPRQLVIRADATPAIGAGHLMRCLAVAEAWRARGPSELHVWGHVDIAFAARRLNLLGIRAGGTYPAWHPSSLLLVDTYDPLERVRLATIAGPRARILVDDTGEPVPPGYDGVWLPSAAGDANLYPGFRGAVFTGLQGVALRADLPPWNPAQPPRIGVLLGGGVLPSNIATALTSLAESMGPIQFAATFADLPPGWTRLSADDPWIELAKCDRVLASAGSIMWEAAAVGIPVVLLLAAENQRRNFEWGRSAGVPCIITQGSTSREICRALVQAIPLAIPLPRIRNGAERLAAAFDGLARGAGHG
jgi:UDP-2,4-diacetamido-2,4,6-trideoxy-beta-L-altropyranose hydrolase